MKANSPRTNAIINPAATVKMSVVSVITLLDDDAARLTQYRKYSGDQILAASKSGRSRNVPIMLSVKSTTPDNSSVAEIGNRTQAHDA